MKLLALIFAALALVGCASTDYAQYSKAQTDIATARHNADAEKYKAFAAIAQQGDATAKVAAVMAMAMGQGGSGAQNTLQAPQANEALQWAGILVPGLTQVAGIAANMRVGIAQSNNAARVAESTNSTFAGIAGLIQAAPTVTTTNTDRHDVYTPAPVIVNTPTPLVPVVVNPPTVINPPVVIQPVVQVVPVIAP